MPYTVQDERERLQRRLVELDQERGHIRYALDVLNRLDRAPKANAEPHTDTAGASARLPGTRDQAVKAVLTIGRPAKVEEIVAVMRAGGWERTVDNPTETVRAALVRAAKDGVIERTGFGLYGPPGSESQSESEARAMMELSSSLNGAAE